MLLYITRTRFLVSFLSMFMLSFTLAYSTFVQASFIPSVIKDFLFEPLDTLYYFKSKDFDIIEVSTLEVKTLDVSDYRQFPTPNGNGDFESYKELLEHVGFITGVNPELLARVVALESSFNAKATPGGTNSAKGLFQFIDDAWSEVVTKHGAHYDIKLSTSPFDPKANAIMGALRVRDNLELLERVIQHREVTEVDVYLAHFLGRTGVQRFLKANPNHVAAHVMPAAASRNRNIFYTPTQQARTVSEVYLAINQRFDKKADEFGIAFNAS